MPRRPRQGTTTCQACGAACNGGWCNLHDPARASEAHAHVMRAAQYRARVAKPTRGGPS
jgi:hypothetical protein